MDNAVHFNINIMRKFEIFITISGIELYILIKLSLNKITSSSERKYLLLKQKSPSL